jgi:hypothetical protein
MTSSTQRAPGDTADDRMTADREETKYLVPPARWELLATELSRRLPGHRFTGEGANHLPDAHHYVTTIYFDTASRALYRAAAALPEHNLKIRAKEYYDLHPSLAEVATDPAQIVRYQPWLWFEVKRRDGTRTAKQRFRLPKRDVAKFFAEGRVTPDALALAGTEDCQRDGLLDVVDTCRTFGEPLRAVCLVNYRRRSWQSGDGTLRVTFDRGLASFAPPADLWERRHALVRSLLGSPAAQETSGVLEIKRRSALPDWLRECLARIDVAPVAFSKFVTAARAVEAHA